MRHMYRMLGIACALLLFPMGAFAQEDDSSIDNAQEGPVGEEVAEDMGDEGYDAEASGYYDDFAAGDYSDDFAAGESSSLKVTARIGAGASAYSIVNDEASKRYGFEDGWIGEDHLWVHVPITFHIRLTDHFSVNGGVLITTFLENELDGKLSGSVLAGLSFYAVPDWLYFGLDFALGYSRVFALVSPKIGHSFNVTDTFSIFIENSMSMVFIGGFIGTWKPVIGAGFTF